MKTNSNKVTTIRSHINTLRGALQLFEMGCPLVAGASLRLQMTEPESPLFPEFAQAARMANDDPAQAAELVKATLQKWEEPT